MARTKGNQIKRSNIKTNTRDSAPSTHPTTRGSDEQSQWLASPHDLIQRFGTEMDRVLEDLGIKRELGNLADQVMDRPFAWSPEIEVIERDGELVIRADLPGLTKDEIKVDLTNDAITIEGERTQHHEERGQNSYRSERRYGHFRRRVPLPFGVDTDEVTAQFRNGVLEITMAAPAAKQHKPRKLEIVDKPATAKAKAAGR